MGGCRLPKSCFVFGLFFGCCRLLCVVSVVSYLQVELNCTSCSFFPRKIVLGCFYVVSVVVGGVRWF